MFQIKGVLKVLLLLCSLLSVFVLNAQEQTSRRAVISFRSGSSVLLRDYKTNSLHLSALEQWIKTQYRADLSSSGYIHIIAYYSDNSPEAINFAAVQAATLLSHFKKMSRDSSFRCVFQLEQSYLSNSVSFELIGNEIPNGANSAIYYTLSASRSIIKRSLDRYPTSAFLSKSSLVAKSAVIRPFRDDVRAVDVEIHYRLNKIKFDTTYLSNPNTIRTIDSLMRLNSARYIDSLHVLGHASPEGPLKHNDWLSINRADAMKKYLVARYPVISPRSVIAEAGGENWAGLRRMVDSDLYLPMKDQILSILSDSTINDVHRQRKIEGLDNGKVYKNYLYPRYYRYLRTGASLFILYDPLMPQSINNHLFLNSISQLAITNDSIVIPKIYFPASSVVGFRYIRPIAFKSNMLFDLATLLNIEIEIPVNKRFSIMGEWVFPFWGGLGNAGGVAPLPVYSEGFTLQMLSGGIEARYWFPRSSGLNKRAWTWGDYNSLCGWFVGLYGGAGLYDFQYRNQGVQGELFFSTGISAGFAHPIAKHLHLEYSLGFGYLQSQYYNYTMMDGHKVVDIRLDGTYDRRRQAYLGLSKLKLSFVWIPQFKVRGN